jgi:hypothetical protein
MAKGSASAPSGLGSHFLSMCVLQGTAKSAQQSSNFCELGACPPAGLINLDRHRYKRDSPAHAEFFARAIPWRLR